MFLAIDPRELASLSYHISVRSVVDVNQNYKFISSLVLKFVNLGISGFGISNLHTIGMSPKVKPEPLLVVVDQMLIQCHDR